MRIFGPGDRVRYDSDVVTSIPDFSTGTIIEPSSYPDGTVTDIVEILEEDGLFAAVEWDGVAVPSLVRIDILTLVDPAAREPIEG